MINWLRDPHWFSQIVTSGHSRVQTLAPCIFVVIFCRFPSLWGRKCSFQTGKRVKRHLSSHGGPCTERPHTLSPFRHRLWDRPLAQQISVPFVHKFHLNIRATALHRGESGNGGFKGPSLVWILGVTQSAEAEIYLHRPSWKHVKIHVGFTALSALCNLSDFLPPHQGPCSWRTPHISQALWGCTVAEILDRTWRVGPETP